MRNRTWLIVVASLAVVVFAVQYHTAQSVAREEKQAQSEARKLRIAQVSAKTDHASAKVTKAIAVVHPLGDSNVKGTVTFTQKGEGVEVVAEMSGLAPGEHGFHVHEFGDCSMADGKCAGGHWNPTNMPHAGPDDARRHAGDLGNIKADEEGNATYKRVDKMLSLNGPTSIVGRSVIVHANPDDFKTQDPPGNAGARIGCGVIGIADPKMAH
jgi:Cu-Zn family superoxide dismutase